MEDEKEGKANQREQHMQRQETGKSLRGLRPLMGPGSRGWGSGPEENGCEPAALLRRPPKLGSASSCATDRKNTNLYKELVSYTSSYVCKYNSPSALKRQQTKKSSFVLQL